MIKLYPPPEIRTAPAGRKVELADVCAAAGVSPRLSVSEPPEIRLHGGAKCFLAVDTTSSPARRVYCLSGSSLPAAPKPRAREILDRLAYQFMDWSAREIVAAERRALMRRLPGELVQSGRFCPTSARVAAHLAQTRSATRADLSEDLRIAQPNLSRTLSRMVSDGVAAVRSRICGPDLVFLTVAGRRLTAEAMDAMAAKEPERQAGLPSPG